MFSKAIAQVSLAAGFYGILFCDHETKNRLKERAWQSASGLSENKVSQNRMV